MPPSSAAAAATISTSPFHRDDPFYRYRMPRLCAKHEGGGNGKKTLLANLDAIADSLKRSADIILKHLGFVLGTKSSIKGSEFYLRGHFSLEELQSHIDSFVVNVCICPKCENPDTSVSVVGSKASARVIIDCTACGHNGGLKAPQKLEALFVKADKKKTTAKGKPRKVSELAAIKNMPEAIAIEEDDGVYSLDTSEAAIKHRRDIAMGSAAVRGLTRARRETSKERLDGFRKFVSLQRVNNRYSPKSILAEAARLEVQTRAAGVVVEELIDDTDVGKSLTALIPLLQRLIMHSPKAQRKLLGGLEAFICRHQERLLNKSPGMLKKLYDNHILDETTILLWWENSVAERNEYLHAAVAPFCIWLREADSESESESESETGAEGHGSDAEIVFESGTLGNDMTSDEEFDIDAI